MAAPTTESIIPAELSYSEWAEVRRDLTNRLIDASDLADNETLEATALQLEVINRDHPHHRERYVGGLMTEDLRRGSTFYF